MREVPLCESDLFVFLMCRENRLIAEDEEASFDVEMFRINRYYDPIPLSKIAVIPRPVFVEAILTTGTNESAKSLVLQVRAVVQVYLAQFHKHEFKVINKTSRQDYFVASSCLKEQF